MRYSFIYSVLHLPTFGFFTVATSPGWDEAQSKTCLPFDLNESLAEEIPPESVSSSDGKIASSPAMDTCIDPSSYTPEQLAANIFVFPGPRGLNPFAGVVSASSHGRDHREYPLGQQSSSCWFSSTSPGQRKTSDSSAGSTCQRLYKKVRTSHRYEPYNAINQHFSLKNSVSDVIPTSSKPAYVLSTEKNPTRNAIGKFKEKESVVCTCLETNKKERKLFNVYDWNYLREYPEREKPNDHQHQYLRCLNQCKHASDVESFFFIQRDQTNEFLTKFISRKGEFEFSLSLKIHEGIRVGMLFETLLRLSDKKINLDGYSFFEKEIIGGTRQRLIKNLETSKNPSSRPRIETIEKFVWDITKVTQLLIVVQLSLFKEHEQEFLTIEEVEKHLRFLQELWLQIDEGTPDIQERDWAMKAHCLFKFQAHQKCVYDLVGQNERKYHFCWNLVDYWREKTGKSFTGCYSEKTFTTKLKDLVTKIIFYSNPPA